MADHQNHRAEDLFGFAAVVGRLDSLVEVPRESLQHELVPMLAAAATTPSRTRAVSDIVLRAAALAASFVLVGGGLAAADALPAPLQEAAASMLRVVGVDVPGGHDESGAGEADDAETADGADQPRDDVVPGDEESDDDRDGDDPGDVDDGDADDGDDGDEADDADGSDESDDESDDDSDDDDSDGESDDDESDDHESDAGDSDDERDDEPDDD